MTKHLKHLFEVTYARRDSMRVIGKEDKAKDFILSLSIMYLHSPWNVLKMVLEWEINNLIT